MKIIALGLFLTLSACGYNIGHYNRTLPKGYKTIFIEMFENRSPEVTSEAHFTNALIKEFHRSGFVLVRDKSAAEVIVKGTVMSVTSLGRNSTVNFRNLAGNAYDATLFTQYGVDAVVHLKLLQAIDEKVLWQTTLRSQKNYYAPILTQSGVRSSNPLYNNSARMRTIASVAQQMMNEAFDRMTENF